MENDSKSGLCMQQILSIVIALMVMSTNIQLFISKEQGNKQKQVIEGNIIEKTQIATKEREIQVITKETTKEREIQVTTRNKSERNLEEREEEKQAKKQEEKKYITIEEISISKNMNLTQRCGISKEDFKTLMKNLKADTSGFFENNSDMIYDLCEKYQLNELFFCGLIAAESGWNIASSHRKANNYVSMMSKGKLIKYSTPEEGLEAAAKLLHNRYLTEGGSYYCGKTLSAVQKRYCPNSSTWVNLVYGCMKQIIK